MKWLLLVSLLCDPCSSADHNIQWLKAYSSKADCTKDAPKAIAALRAANAAAFAAAGQSAVQRPIIYACEAFSVAEK